GGSAGQDAVVIGGIALGFHQCLAAAVRTAKKIRKTRSVGKARLDDLLGDFGHDMDGAVAEVRDLFGMAEGPCCVDGSSRVSRVGAGGSVAGEDGSGEMGVVEFAGEASVAVGLKFSVPIFGGEPDFDQDV